MKYENWNDFIDAIAIDESILRNKYLFITLYCVEEGKPYYYTDDNNYVHSNGAMIDIILGDTAMTDKSTLYVKGHRMDLEDEQMEEVMKDFFKNKGIKWEDEFYPFRNADFIEGH